MTETIDIIVKESGADKAARDILNVGTAADKSAVQVDALNANLNKLAQSVDKNTTQQAQLAEKLTQTAAGHQKASQAGAAHTQSMEQGAVAAEQLRGVLVSLGLALGIDQWVKTTDAITGNINQLRQVTHSTEEFTAVQRQLKGISDETFTSLDANTKSYVAMAKAGRDLHLTDTDLLNIIRNVNDAVKMGGGDTEEASQAMTSFGIALQRGSISARQILPLLHAAPDLLAALADKFGFTRDRTAGFIQALSSGQIPLEQVMKAMGGLNNTIQAGTKHLDEATRKALEANGSVQILGKGIGDLGVNFGGAASKVIMIHQGLDNAGEAAESMAHKTDHATDGLNKFAKTAAEREPTIANAWTNMRTALETYVGQQDRMLGTSSKVAEFFIELSGHAHVLFGSLAVLGSALATYTIGVNAARIATLLFASSFSPITLAVSLLVAAGAAMIAFGNDIKLTSDGSITALGALNAVLAIVREAVVVLWNLVGAAAGPWGQAALAVGGLVVAMQVLLGLNVVSWIASAVGALGTMALATYAAIGPWGLLAAAIITAALAVAYYTGNLDGAIEAVKNQMGPALDYVKDKMKETTAGLMDTSVATRDFGKTTQDAAVMAQSSFNTMAHSAAAATTSIKQSLRDDSHDFQDWAGEVDTSLSSVISKAASTSSSLASLRNGGGGVVSASQHGGIGGGGFDFTPGSSFNFGSSFDFGSSSGFATGGSFTVGGQGGTDSQLVKFMASPNERVTVETPDQQKQKASGGNTTVQVTMNVTTPDATSFNANRQQTVMALQSELTRALRRIGAA